MISTHTSDCPNCDFRLAKVPHQYHQPNSRRPVYAVKLDYPRFLGEHRGSVYSRENLEQYNVFGDPVSWEDSPPIGYIPQVEETFAYFEGAYGILNEHQVAMGESTCGAKLVSLPVHVGGHALFDITELNRVALERCKTARCAIKTMGALAEEYGFYGAEWTGGALAQSEAGESMAISDPHEHWIFHILPDDTGRSAVWIAQRVPDDHVAAVANQFVIRQIDLSDPDNFLGSSNIHDVATRNGFWDPASGQPFDFTLAYAVERALPAYATRRVWRILSTAAPSLNLPPNTDPFGSDYPFSVKAERKLSLDDIAALHRDHYEGTPFDQTKGLAAGPFGNPNRYDSAARQGDLSQGEAESGGFERSISIFRATQSFLTQSRSWLPEGFGAKLHWATYAPHASIYTPVWIHAEHLPAPLTTGSMYVFLFSYPLCVHGLPCFIFCRIGFVSLSLF